MRPLEPRSRCGRRSRAGSRNSISCPGSAGSSARP